MDNKSIFARNLQQLMAQEGKTRREICDALGFSYYTFSDWVNGKKYPRMDKVEMLAKYFGVLKSDLIEDKSEKESSPDKLALTEGEQVWLDLYRRLSNDGREMLDKSVRLLTSVPDDQQEILVELLRIALKNQQ